MIFLKARLLVYFLMITVLCPLHSQVDWIRTGGGLLNDMATGTTIDNNGEIIVVGNYRDSIDIDFGSNELNLSAQMSNHPYGYIMKLDASGNLIWARSIGNGNAGLSFESVLTDSQNNIIAVGSFGVDSCDFDPGPNNYFITPNGTSSDAFMIQLTAGGNFNWAVGFGGSGGDRIVDVSVDNNDNLFVCGPFEDTVDFDPSPQIDQRISSGYRDCFIQKYSNNGDLLWTNTYGGLGYDHIDGCTVDSQNNLIICGAITDSIDLDPSAGVNIVAPISSSDTYVSKFDNSGNYLWTKIFGGYCNAWADDVITDLSDNIILLGSFQGNIDVDPGILLDTIESIGTGNNLLVLKLTSSGDYLSNYYTGDYLSPWSLFIFPEDIVIDSDGQILIVGSFQGGVDFDPSPSTFELYSEFTISPFQNPRDVFVAKLDSELNFLWAGETNSVGYNDENGYALAVSPIGQTIMVGDYSYDCDFGFSGTSIMATTNGARDIFIISLNESVGLDEIFPENVQTVYPNPTEQYVTISGVEGLIQILDVFGKILHETSDTQIDLSEYPSGIYFLKTESKTHKVILK